MEAKTGCGGDLIAAVLVIALCGAAGNAAPIEPQEVTLVGNPPPLIVDPASNSGQVWVRLKNPRSTATPVTLELGSFLNKGANRVLNTQATFYKGTETTGTPFLRHEMAAGEMLWVKIQVSGLSEAGESVAELAVNAATYPLRAVHFDVPFNVSITTTTPDRPELLLRRDEGGQLVLKNDDAMTYTVAGRLYLPDEGSVAEQTWQLPRKSTVAIPVTAPGTWFRHWFEGFFKDHTRGGYLSLRFAPTTEPAPPVLPVKTLPVQLRLAYWSDTVQAWVGGIVVLALLLFGGLCSLMLNLWIPNKLLRIDLERRLDQLANNTRAISGKTDSNLRVGVRVERLRLFETLRALKMSSPDVSEILKELDKKASMLGRRVELVKALDVVTRRLATLRTETSGAPPTLLNEAARSIDEATKVLNEMSPAEEDFRLAQTAIQDANGRLDKLDQENADLAAKLASRVKDLRKDYDETSGPTGKRKKCKELRPKVLDVFEILNGDKYEQAANIQPREYHWIDVSIKKLEVLQHYIIRFEDATPDTERQTRIRKREERLIELLRLQNWEALDLARRLRKQVEENVFVDDVSQAIQDRRVGVEHEPLTVYPNEAARLRVKFDDPRFDTCTARRDFACVWAFGTTVGQEEGWEIAHYFRSGAEAHFHVKFKGAQGRPIADQAGKEIDLEARVPVQSHPKDKSRNRAKVETVRLFLALGIALLALVAGAREQLLKLDLFVGLIAVFLVGFGADTIKNLFSKRA